MTEGTTTTAAASSASTPAPGSQRRKPRRKRNAGKKNEPSSQQKGGKGGSSKYGKKKSGAGGNNNNSPPPPPQIKITIRNIQNPEKFQFCQREVHWSGFTIGKDSVRPMPHITKAIRHFPVPVNKTDLRSLNNVPYLICMVLVAVAIGATIGLPDVSTASTIIVEFCH